MKALTNFYYLKFISFAGWQLEKNNENYNPQNLRNEKNCLYFRFLEYKTQGKESIVVSLFTKTLSHTHTGTQRQRKEEIKEKICVKYTFIRATAANFK